jgi:hypothetical protein
MVSFDYNAPAELFLSKVAAPSIAVSRLRLRRSVMPLRTYAYPKPSAHGLRSGMSNSFYSAPEPSTFPVFGFTRCTWAHARHLTWK